MYREYEGDNPFLLVALSIVVLSIISLSIYQGGVFHRIEIEPERNCTIYTER